MLYSSHRGRPGPDGGRGYPLQPAALTCIASYAYVYGLWKLRLWGGGDAKLVLGLFLLALPPILLYTS